MFQHAINIRKMTFEDSIRPIFPIKAVIELLEVISFTLFPFEVSLKTNQEVKNVSVHVARYSFIEVQGSAVETNFNPTRNDGNDGRRYGRLGRRNGRWLHVNC